MLPSLLDDFLAFQEGGQLKAELEGMRNYPCMREQRVEVLRRDQNKKMKQPLNANERFHFCFSN